MTGHTFLYSPAVRKIQEIIAQGDIGEIRYICARRLNLGLFQMDINVAWDLAPHDLSVILTLIGRTTHQCKLPRQRARHARHRGRDRHTKLALSHHNGVIGVISGVCNHAGGPLGQGKLDGNYVVCPWHN